MQCKKENILLTSNRLKYVEFVLSIEKQNRNLRDDDLLKLKWIVAGTQVWKMLNDSERCTINRERYKTK